MKLMIIVVTCLLLMASIWVAYSALAYFSRSDDILKKDPEYLLYAGLAFPAIALCLTILVVVLNG